MMLRSYKTLSTMELLDVYLNQENMLKKIDIVVN